MFAVLIVLSFSGIGNEDLIHAVEEYPEIWNRGGEDYKNRNKKYQAWQAVSSKLVANFEDKDAKDRYEIGKIYILLSFPRSVYLRGVSIPLKKCANLTLSG